MSLTLLFIKEYIPDQLQFANCLTAPHLPTFIYLLTLTPPAIILLSLPLYAPLARRALQAYRFSSSSEAIVAGWWNWWASWVIAGGPVGRYVGGMVLGWRELDKMDGGGAVRLGIGGLVGLGLILALITTVSRPAPIHLNRIYPSIARSADTRHRV
jgi:hypothetical protein